MKSFNIMPEQASNFAWPVDILYFIFTFLTVLFCILVFLPIIYLVIRYRVGAKVDRSNRHHHNTKLELLWSIIPFCMGAPLYVFAAYYYVDMYAPYEGKDALNITVVGKQWMWQLQHPTGQRENNELHIPVNKPIKLSLISQDVIHAFFIPAFRVKRDVLPERFQTMWFKPTKTGKYHLFCAEFCGTKHSEMTGTVYVMELHEYEAWLKQERWGIDNQKMNKPFTMAQMGEKHFIENGCVSCHSGKVGEKGPPLAGIFGTQRAMSDGRMILADDDYIRRSIREPNTMKLAGYAAEMPAYPPQRLSEQQIFELIAYIKSLLGETETVTPTEQKNSSTGSNQ